MHGVCMACAWRVSYLGPELRVVQLDAALAFVGGKGRLREGPSMLRGRSTVRGRSTIRGRSTVKGL